MNYVRHLNQAFEQFRNDEKITAVHITLYMALFRAWNQNRFINPVRIFREEVMKTAKINSNSTYTKCIKELHHWRYIEYTTSFNHALGTKVSLFDLCNGELYSNCNASITNTITPAVQQQYINKINNINLGKGAFAPPTQEDVLKFFIEKKEEAIEAEKFYNHFESNGWKVGGKTKMKDWQASARNWILNKDKFNNHATNQQTTPKPRHLETSNNKNFAEPL